MSNNFGDQEYKEGCNIFGAYTPLLAFNNITVPANTTTITIAFAGVGPNSVILLTPVCTDTMSCQIQSQGYGSFTILCTTNANVYKINYCILQ